MNLYEKISAIALKISSPSKVFKWLFNLSPMYKRSTGKIYFVSDDIHTVKIKIPLSYRNRNYAGSIFGGSLLSATDPIYMIQLVSILGKGYVVWDKETNIKFKRPARSTAFASFEFTTKEIQDMQEKVTKEGEINWIKELLITDKDQNTLCIVSKTLYIANKDFYKEKMRKRQTT